jgi:hypothetical protein
VFTEHAIAARLLVIASRNYDLADGSTDQMGQLGARNSETTAQNGGEGAMSDRDEKKKEKRVQGIRRE